MLFVSNIPGVTLSKSKASKKRSRFRKWWLSHTEAGAERKKMCSQQQPPGRVDGPGGQTGTGIPARHIQVQPLGTHLWDTNAPYLNYHDNWALFKRSWFSTFHEFTQVSLESPMYPVDFSPWTISINRRPSWLMLSLGFLHISPPSSLNETTVHKVTLPHSFLMLWSEIISKCFWFSPYCVSS